MSGVEVRGFEVSIREIAAITLSIAAMLWTMWFYPAANAGVIGGGVYFTIQFFSGIAMIAVDGWKEELRKWYCD